MLRDRAGNGTRTRDINLGKVALYQLSYSRTPEKNIRTLRVTCKEPFDTQEALKYTRSSPESQAGVRAPITV
jgi:hypothetical protein